MLKQSGIYLLLSILVVVFAKYAHLVVIKFDLAFNYVYLKLTPYFAQLGLSVILGKTIVLMLLPIVVVGIPALLYRLIKGKDMPHMLAATWILWTILVLSTILIP